MDYSSPEATTTYRPPFLPVFLVIFLLGLLCGAGLRWVMVAAGTRTPGVISYTYIQFAAIVYVWAMAATALVVWVLTVHVGRTGLRGRTFWGAKRDLAWGDIARVTREKPLGALFAKVHSGFGGAPIWLPLFLKRKSEFREDVNAYTRADHPLRTVV
jgi:hypothetical protein